VKKGIGLFLGMSKYIFILVSLLLFSEVKVNAKWVDIDGEGKESWVVIDTNSFYNKICIDNNGMPHIFFIVANSTANEIVLNLAYLKWNGKEWVDVDGVGRESMIVTDYVGGYQIPSSGPMEYSFCLDSSNNPHIVWIGTDPNLEKNKASNSSHDYYLFYLYWNGKEWVDVDGIGQESKKIKYLGDESNLNTNPILILDKSGNPHIMWLVNIGESLYNANYHFNYLYWNGHEWVDIDGEGQESIDPLSKIFHETGEGIVGYDVFMPSGFYGFIPYYALDSNGYPHLVWSGVVVGDNKFYGYYLKWDGNRWVDVKGSSSLEAKSITMYSSEYQIVYPTLRLDEAERPHISFFLDYPPRKVGCLYWNGSEWVDVDGEGQESIYVIDGSCYFVLDKKGFPHFYGITEEENIFYFRWNGKEWVDADGEGQESVNITKGYLYYPNSLVLDSYENPRLGFAIEISTGEYRIVYLHWKDDLSPSAITDLKTEPGTNEGEVNLSWTMPGDDGRNGNFIEGNYYIYCSTSIIEVEKTSLSEVKEVRKFNWIESGIKNELVITGLEPGVTYYFRIWIGDEVPNISDGSNIDGTWAQLPAPVPPDKVEVFKGTGISATGIKWEWKENLSNKKGYRIKDSTGNIIAVLSAQSTYFIEEGLEVNTYYERYIVAYNEAGESEEVIAGAYTLTETPDVSKIEVTSTTIKVYWNGKNNPPSTEYSIEWSSDYLFNVIAGSYTLKGTSYTIKGLYPHLYYWIKVKSINGDRTGVYSEVISTRTYADRPPEIVEFSAESTGWDRIRWSWTVFGENGVILKDEDGKVISEVKEGKGYYIEDGLLPNTSYQRYIEAFNEAGNTISQKLTKYTLTKKVTDFSIIEVTTDTIKVFIKDEINPDWTVYELEWSRDSNFYTIEGRKEKVEEGTQTIKGLQGGVEYYIRIRGINIEGEKGEYSNIISTRTGEVITELPLPVENFHAVSIDGARIRLEWEVSVSSDVEGYNIYWDSGTGIINYAKPIASIKHPATSWTTWELEEGKEYRFGIRVEDKEGKEEKNTTRVATAKAVFNITGIKARIKVPKPGKKITGNSITIMAEIEGDRSNYEKVLFQYKKEGEYWWQNIEAANSNHPNPDKEYPYFIHWNVSELEEGKYYIRAIAYGRDGSYDRNPESVMIIIDHQNPEIKEEIEGKKHRKQEIIDTRRRNRIFIGYPGTKRGVRVEIPEIDIVQKELTTTMILNPDTIPQEPERVIPLGDGTTLKIEIPGDEVVLSKGAKVVFIYEDSDNDGYLDYHEEYGMKIPIKEEYLAIYHYNEEKSRWEKLITKIDKENNTIEAEVRSFSYFALFGLPAEDLENVIIYPNPYKEGQGDGNIHIENLTLNTEVKIYTVSGKLIWEKKDIDTGEITWDTRNKSGRKVASGVYIIVIENDLGDKRIEKVGIIR